MLVLLPALLTARETEVSRGAAGKAERGQLAICGSRVQLHKHPLRAYYVSSPVLGAEQEQDLRSGSQAVMSGHNRWRRQTATQTLRGARAGTQA